MKSSLVSAAALVTFWCSQGVAHVAHIHGQAPIPVSSQSPGHRYGSPSPSALSDGSSPRRRDGLAYTQTAKAAIDTMNKFYNETQGRWSPEIAWWLSGFALQDLLDYMYKTGSREYMEQARYIIELQKAPIPWWPQGGGNFRADSTDDTGWWALALLRMFDLTGDQAYLNISILDEAYMYSYWTDTDCGGGMYVDIRDKTYKNAIANELYMLLTASLHNRTPGDIAYLAKAKATWEWFKSSGMINSENLINDGLVEKDGVCSNNGLPVWSYNQGVILAALTELYRATNDTSYLDQGRKIADAVIANKLLTPDPDRVLTDPCEVPDTCNNDQHIFKGIFARELAELSSSLDGDPYRAYLEQNARAAVKQDRNATGFYDVAWRGPFRNSTLGKQASAVGLFVALI